MTEAETAELREKMDATLASLHRLEGQLSVVSPRDVIALKEDFASVKTRVYSISGLISLIGSGIVTWLFGGHGGHS